MTNTTPRTDLAAAWALADARYVTSHAAYEAYWDAANSRKATAAEVAAAWAAYCAAHNFSWPAYCAALDADREAVREDA